MNNDTNITVALDGTGGDNVDAKTVASAVRFALVLYPNIKIKVYGSQKLKVA